MSLLLLRIHQVGVGVEVVLLKVVGVEVVLLKVVVVVVVRVVVVVLLILMDEVAEVQAEAEVHQSMVVDEQAAEVHVRHSVWEVLAEAEVLLLMDEVQQVQQAGEELDLKV